MLLISFGFWLDFLAVITKWGSSAMIFSSCIVTALHLLTLEDCAYISLIYDISYKD